jgi:hypothetical protein
MPLKNNGPGGCCCGGGGGGGTVFVPFCGCNSGPATLAMVSNDHSADFGYYQDSPLIYGPPPSVVAGTFYTGYQAYFSPTTFTQTIVPDQFVYMLTCSTLQTGVSAVYTLSAVYVTGPGVGGNNPLFDYSLSAPNTCTPFSLTRFTTSYLGSSTIITFN